MPATLAPPLPPMLARLQRDLPERHDLVYEPKWDGFRCIAFRRGDDVDLRSRNDRPLGRYFPELVKALRALPADPIVLDGEIVVRRDGVFDFESLLQRLHPAATRVDRLRRETPAWFIAFDLLGCGDDLHDRPFEERRHRLEALLAGIPPPLFVTPATRDRDVAARWLEEFQGNGVDGVIAKHPDQTYQPGKRAMLKIKKDRTADCVVAGFRWHFEERTVGSLLLGLYEGEVLRHVGLAASFTADRRRDLVGEVEPYVTGIKGHPWEHGFNIAGPMGRLPGAASRWAYGSELTWIPLRPQLVCEVAYDHLQTGRFRHPPRFRRWRWDRDPSSCTFDQFEEPPVDAAEILRRAP